MVFLLKRSKFPLRQRFYWTVVAHNGEPLATSEMYKNRSDARAAIDLLTYEVGRGVFEVKDLTQ